MPSGLCNQPLQHHSMHAIHFAVIRSFHVFCILSSFFSIVISSKRLFPSTIFFNLLEYRCYNIPRYSSLHSLSIFATFLMTLASRSKTETPFSYNPNLSSFQHSQYNHHHLHLQLIEIGLLDIFKMDNNWKGKAFVRDRGPGGGPPLRSKIDSLIGGRYNVLGTLGG